MPRARNVPQANSRSRVCARALDRAASSRGSSRWMPTRPNSATITRCRSTCWSVRSYMSARSAISAWFQSEWSDVISSNRRR